MPPSIFKFGCWILLSIPIVLCVALVLSNAASGGVGLKFDELSYVCIFRDFATTGQAQSPYTAPKVFPILAAGVFFHLTHSLVLLTLYQGFFGALLLLEIFRLGRNLGLSNLLAFCAVFIILSFNLPEVSSGNAAIIATWLLLVACTRYFKVSSWPDPWSCAILCCACLCRPEPMVFLMFVAVAAVWGILEQNTEFSFKRLLLILFPVCLTIMLTLLFDRLVFMDWFYSSRQVRSFAQAQSTGKLLLSEFPVWDQPPNWRQLFSALNAGPLMNNGLLLKVATVVLVALGYRKGRRLTTPNLVLALFAISNISAGIIYKLMGLVIYPRFFLLSGISIAVWSAIGIQSLHLRTLHESLLCLSRGSLRKALLFILFAVVLIAGLRQSYRSFWIESAEMIASRQCANLCLRLQAQLPETGKFERMITTNNAPLLAILLNKEIDAFIPLGWIPSKCGQLGCSSNGSSASSIGQIMTGVSQCEYILTFANGQLSTALMTLLPKNRFKVYDREGNYVLYRNSALDLEYPARRAQTFRQQEFWMPVSR